MSLEERLAAVYEAYYTENPGDYVHKVGKRNWNRFYGNTRQKIRTAAPEKLIQVHQQIRGSFAFLPDLTKDNAEYRRRGLGNLLVIIARREIGILGENYTQNEIWKFVDYLAGVAEEGDISLAGQEIGILDKYTTYQNNTLGKYIIELVNVDPEVEFYKTREMKRRFHLHFGPTNSGKTHDSIEVLKGARHGVYLGPLRLLALEIYDTMTEAGVPCSMVTGEEQIYTEDARVVSQTIETLDIDDIYDIAVIDEGQMICDENRGHAWSRAIMGIMAKDIYICASDNVKDLLLKIIENCSDEAEIIYHDRKTELLVEKDFIFLDKEHIRPGDCLIAFTKRRVLELAAGLELEGFKVSVIYGKLPPEIRRREVSRFISGKTQVVVATDAIGMGVNLPVKRIIFTADKKFDGISKRPLKADEIVQIAGRAGRYGKFEKGYVTTSIPDYNQVVEAALMNPLPRVESARLGFPTVLLSLDEELDSIIKTWARIEANPPYEKISIEEMIGLYNALKSRSENFSLLEDRSRQAIYRLISMPVDYTNQYLLEQWLKYCLEYEAAPYMEFPEKPFIEKGTKLEREEVYYRLLELYHLFSVHMDKRVDEERLWELREQTEQLIDEIIGSKKKFIKKCKYCGRVLTMETVGRLCMACRKYERFGVSRFAKKRKN